MKSSLSPVLDAWSIRLHAVRRDIAIPGSPERCDKRFVVEDNRNNLFLLERILSGNVSHRCRMARVLDALKKNGLSDAIPYIPDSRGNYTIYRNGGNWQLSPYVSGISQQHPHSLEGDLIHALIASLKEAGIFSPLSWEFLVEFIVALRFAWLSEWLRKNDTEMIELETVYLHLLMDNAGALKDIWQCNQKKA